MQIEIEKKDGTSYNTNLSSLSREIYLAMNESHLLHKTADSFIVINTIYDAVEKLVRFKDN
tara:strand:+ start:577 stop:759 length:183 start_codon:yes stop_codon:yes gene_type:complete